MYGITPDKDFGRSQVPVAPVENHREREKGVLVYPVYSRRSGGLSLGINLFPGGKQCSFNCPYCEVFPFSANAEFSLQQMKEDLQAALAAALEQNIPVKDICFSGNGEPSLSLDFPAALKLAARIRSETVPAAELVLITNGGGLLEPEIFTLLRDAVSSFNLNIWLKLDAGTPGWYAKINRSDIPFDTLIERIREFAALVPVTIQTMLCALDGSPPPLKEALAWEQTIVELAAAANLRGIQLYGKARPSLDDPKAAPLPPAYLEGRATALRRRLAGVRLNAPQVKVFL
jgi:histidinol dehydrogenase